MKGRLPLFQPLLLQLPLLLQPLLRLLRLPRGLEVVVKSSGGQRVVQREVRSTENNLPSRCPHCPKLRSLLPLLDLSLLESQLLTVPQVQWALVSPELPVEARWGFMLAMGRMLRIPQMQGALVGLLHHHQLLVVVCLQRTRRLLV